MDSATVSLFIRTEYYIFWLTEEDWRDPSAISTNYNVSAETNVQQSEVAKVGVDIKHT